MPNQTTLFNYRWIIIPSKFLQMTSACSGPVAEGRHWVKGLMQSSQLHLVALPVWGGGGIWPILEVEASVKQKTLVWLSALFERQLGLRVQEGDELFVWVLIRLCEGMFWFLPLPRTEDCPLSDPKLMWRCCHFWKYLVAESDAFGPGWVAGYPVNQAFPVHSRSWGHLEEGLTASGYSKLDIF